MSVEDYNIYIYTENLSKLLNGRQFALRENIKPGVGVDECMLHAGQHMRDVFSRILSCLSM